MLFKCQYLNVEINFRYLDFGRGTRKYINNGNAKIFESEFSMGIGICFVIFLTGSRNQSNHLFPSLP